MQSRLVLFTLLLGSIQPVLAQAAAEENTCRGMPTLAGSPPLTPGRITGTERAYFVEDGLARKGCPAATPECRAKAYLVAGDRVILGARLGDYVCVLYPSQKSNRNADLNRTGWLPAASVASEPPEPVAVDGWLGTWKGVDSTIEIKPGKAPGELAVSGDAVWGAGDPDRVARGAIHTGSIEGTRAPSGDRLSFTMGEDKTLPVDQGDTSDCKVWMQRVGPWLAVDDNLACGGMNVTFRGLYRGGSQTGRP